MVAMPASRQTRLLILFINNAFMPDSPSPVRKAACGFGNLFAYRLMTG
jgi:hypothetical protein